jgi:hypothetical protein
VLLQMFIDSLPIWGFIGKVEKLPAQGAKAGEGGEQKEKLSLFTHIHFDMRYNKDRVIQVDISTGAVGWEMRVRCGAVLCCGGGVLGVLCPRGCGIWCAGGGGAGTALEMKGTQELQLQRGVFGLRRYC